MILPHFLHCPELDGFPPRAPPHQTLTKSLSIFFYQRRGVRGKRLKRMSDGGCFVVRGRKAGGIIRRGAAQAGD